ncbi:MAG: hypothetical protein AB1641_24965 [Thermodesulfobacteriota bacterium]
MCFMRLPRLARLIVLGLALIIPAGSAGAQQLQRVLVLPFKMNAPQDTTYLQQGIQDMLSSRLEWPDRVAVVPRSEARAAFDKVKGNVDATSARELAKAASADYVVFGSVTMLGQNVSLDARMLDVKGQKSPVTFAGQSQGLDGVIPKVNEFAEEINSRVFGRRAGEKAAQGPAPPLAPVKPGDPGAAGRRHPDYLLMGQEGRQMGRSLLNPNFISAIGSEEREGAFWRSPSFPAVVIGMDVGDIDGDGKNELVYATRTSVYASRIVGGDIQRVALYEGMSSDRFLSLDVFDARGTGKAQIFISNQRRLDARSLVLEYQNGQLVPIIQDAPWYYRVVVLPGGPRLLGQRGGTGERFFGKVHQMRFAGREILPGQELSLPAGYNLFDFALADMTGTGKEYMIAVRPNEQLTVMARGGQEVWRSKDDFAGTMNYLEEPAVNDPQQIARGDKDNKKTFIPARILIADLDADGKKEIIVARNEKSGTDMLPRLRGFSRGSIYSLGLKEMSVRENWRSRELPGPVFDYQVKDYNNDGRPELVVAVVLEYGVGIMEARSAIAAYELATPEEMREMMKKRDTQY